MLRRRTIPIRPRFPYAVKHAYEVLAHIGVTELQIDPSTIGEFYLEIHMVSYVELKMNTREADPLFFQRKMLDPIS